MSLQKYFGYVLTVFNISLAVFFCLWQLIVSLCIPVTGGTYRSQCFGVPVGLAYDSFFYITFYLIILLATIFFFLVAPERWIEKVRKLKIFFLTINLVFIAFLFFEL